MNLPPGGIFPGRKQRPCPPPLIRRTPTGPCVRPTGVPFGGPASGLWPSGGGAAPAPAEAPGEVVTPVPGPTCTTAAYFADCFAGCTGTISGASPGPICEWLFEPTIPPTGGTITFTPGLMTFNTTGASQVPGATKPLDAPLVSVFNLTGQFEFNEFATPPVVGTAYDYFINNAALSQVVQVALLGDGNAIVTVGPPAGADLYLGAWTPNNGSHEVHFTVDGIGVPRLWIDGVEIPLAFFFNVPTFATDYPTNSATVFMASGSAVAASASYENLFLTTGQLALDTEFCCP